MGIELCIVFALGIYPWSSQELCKKNSSIKIIVFDLLSSNNKNILIDLNIVYSTISAY